MPGFESVIDKLDSFMSSRKRKKGKAYREPEYMPEPDIEIRPVARAAHMRPSGAILSGSARLTCAPRHAGAVKPSKPASSPRTASSPPKLKSESKDGAVLSEHVLSSEAGGGFLLGTISEDNPESGRYKGMLALRSERLMKKYGVSNRNVLIFGPPGSGKTSSVMVPNIFETMRRGRSMFVSDPKGELKAITEPIAKIMGYTTRTFNLINARDSDGWNIMEWLSSLKEDQQQWVNTIGNMIIQNTTPPDTHEDPFFSSAAEALLKALMYFILEITAPAEDIQDSNIDKIDESLDYWRNQKLNTLDPAQRENIKAKIYALQQSKTKVINLRIQRLQQDIDSKLDDAGRELALEAIYRLERYRDEQEIIESPKSLSAPDYECYTIAEAKALMRNMSTCVRLLEYPLDDEKKKDARTGGRGDENDEILNKAKERKIMARAKDGRLTNEAFGEFFSELRFSVDPGNDQINLFYKSLSQIFSLLGAQKGIASRCFIGFRNSPANARSSAQMTLSLRLNAYTQDDIIGLTSRNEIDILEAGRSKCVYYCLLRDSDTSLAYISAQFINTALVRLQSFADSLPARRLPNDVEFYLDEFPNIGFLPAFTIKLSTYRSRGIHFILAIQSFPQLLERYTENLAHEIMGDCELQIFLGCGDLITGRLISELYGIMTTATTGYRETQNKLALFADLETTKSETEGERNIMNIDELLRLGARGSNEMIASYHGEIIKLKRHPYFNYPGYKEIEEIIRKSQKRPVTNKKSPIDNMIGLTDVPIEPKKAATPTYGAPESASEETKEPIEEADVDETTTKAAAEKAIPPPPITLDIKPKHLKKEQAAASAPISKKTKPDKEADVKPIKGPELGNDFKSAELDSFDM